MSISYATTSSLAPPLGLLSLVWFFVCPLIVPSPVAFPASIVANCPLPVHGCYKPFCQIEKAVEWFGIADIICNFVDDGCWPLETFPLAKLCLDQHHVEKRAFVAKDCPCNTVAHVGCERVSDGVDFLLIQCVTNLKETLVVVALVSKVCPDKSTEGVNAQAQLEVVIRQWAWWSLLAVPDIIKLRGTGHHALCLFIILDDFDLVCHFWAARED